MAVTGALGRARKAQTPTAAARLRLQLLDDLAGGELDEFTAGDHEDAIEDLERRYPEVRELNDPRSVDDYAEGLRARGKAPLSGKTPARQQPRQAAGESAGGTTAKKPAASPPAGSRQAGRRPRTSTRGRAQSRGRRSAARRAIEQTGIPSAARSTSAFVLQGLGIVVGLSVAYLLLRNAQGASRGRSAIEQIAGGFARGVQLVVAPVDPLGRGRVIDPAKPGSLATAQPGDTVDLTNTPPLVPLPQLRPGRGSGATAGVGAPRAGAEINTGAIPRLVPPSQLLQHGGRRRRTPQSTR